MRRDRDEAKNSRGFTYYVSVVVLVTAICVCVVMLLSTLYFFFQNQRNINRVYQNADFTSPAEEPAPDTSPLPGTDSSVITLAPDEMVIRKDEYITRLSEAQNTASSRDLLSLLYGVLSTVFITVGLHFLKETGKACEDAKEMANAVTEDVKKFRKKLTPIANDLKELRLRIDKLENEHPLLLVMYIEFFLVPVSSYCLSIESFFLRAGLDGQTRRLARQYFPRIRDDLRSARDFCKKIQTPPDDELIGDLQVITGSVSASLSRIKKIEANKIKTNNSAPKPVVWEPMTSAWDEFLDYCGSILDKLNELILRSSENDK